jgi:pimeloyl-ACP methyl ester carboxylesterase
VLDVVNTLNWEDAHDAILVGHSYGGLVIAGAAERTPARLGHLVYLDALVPADGDTWRSVAPDPPRWAAWDEAAARDGGGWLLQHPGEDGLRGWGVTDPADLAWAAPRLTPQPIGTSREPVRLGNPAAAALPRTYVWASYKPTGDRFARFREAARAPGSGWRYREVEGGHDAMVTHPREIADLLLELA